MNKFLLALVTLGFAGGLAADVQIKIRDPRGGDSTISSDGQRARIDSGMMPGYVIIDYAQGQMLMVDSARNKVMRSGIGGSAGGAEGIDVRLQDKGGGQKIAGYLTRKYELTSDGEKCGTVYASQKLLANAGVRAMFESLRQMQRASRGMTAGLGGLIPNCQRATMQLGEVLESAGAPMKILDQNGGLVSQVTSVDTAKKLAPDYYQLPPGAEVVEMNQMMDQALEQTQQIMQQMPGMDELMQQMQKSGGQMTEQMQQQLQKMQRMLQQQ